MDEALEFVRRHEERWCLAELLRKKGELYLIDNAKDLQGRGRAGKKVLAPVYRRFTEGFKTADMHAASALLERLR